MVALRRELKYELLCQLLVELEENREQHLEARKLAS